MRVRIYFNIQLSGGLIDRLFVQPRSLKMCILFDCYEFMCPAVTGNFFIILHILHVFPSLHSITNVEPHLHLQLWEHLELIQHSLLESHSGGNFIMS